MSHARSALAAGIVLLGSALAVRADALESTSWRWTAWTPSMGIAPLRWGTVGQAPPTTVSAATVSPAPAPVPAPAPAPPKPTAPPAASAPPVAAAPSLPISRFASTPVNPTFVLPPASTAPSPVYAPPTINTPPVYSADAYVNMSDSSYSAAQSLTTGAAAPWYLSPVVLQLYGGTPDAQERLAFTTTVVDRVRATFEQSGLPISVTADPTVSAAHTLSVVSNTRSPSKADAVGMTEVGRDGFTFLDKLGYASSIDELQWAVAHNVAHELMHAFGVERHDTTHGYIDSAVSDWSALVSPSTIFSPEAVRELSSRNFRDNGIGMAYGAQLVNAAPVPEPATLVAWAAALATLGAVARARSRSSRSRNA